MASGYIAPRPLARKDFLYFKDHPGAAFRLRDPLPGEYTPEELVRPGHGAAVCFVLKRCVLLRWRLPPHTATDAGVTTSINSRIQRGRKS